MLICRAIRKGQREAVQQGETIGLREKLLSLVPCLHVLRREAGDRAAAGQPLWDLPGSAGTGLWCCFWGDATNSVSPQAGKLCSLLSSAEEESPRRAQLLGPGYQAPAGPLML